MWREATLVCLLFPLSQLFPHVRSATKTQLLTVIVIRPPRLYLKTFLHNPSSKGEFLQRREECRIKDGILVIKAIEFPVDLRWDLNAPCLHSLWGGAGNINDSPFYLIPCQKQSLWGVGPGRHLAQSSFTQHRHRTTQTSPDFSIWPLKLQLTIDNLPISVLLWNTYTYYTYKC